MQQKPKTTEWFDENTEILFGLNFCFMSIYTEKKGLFFVIELTN